MVEYRTIHVSPEVKELVDDTLAKVRDHYAPRGVHFSGMSDLLYYLCGCGKKVMDQEDIEAAKLFDRVAQSRYEHGLPPLTLREELAIREGGNPKLTVEDIVRIRDEGEPYIVPREDPNWLKDA